MLLLSCDFSKRSTYAAFGIAALIEGMILNSGDRGEAVCGILILIIYTIFRCRRDPNFLIHKKLAIVGICCSLPFAAFALQIIKYTRVGNAADINFWDGFFEFFESQGVSINIISNEIKYRNEISQIGGHAFVIKQIVSYLQQNVLFRTLLGSKNSRQYGGNGDERIVSWFDNDVYHFAEQLPSRNWMWHLLFSGALSRRILDRAHFGQRCYSTPPELD